METRNVIDHAVDNDLNDKIGQASLSKAPDNENELSYASR